MPLRCWRFVTARNGQFRVEAVEGDGLRTANADGNAARWYQGLFLVRRSSIGFRLADGELWPLAVGRRATIVEQREWTGGFVRHEISVDAVDELELDGRPVATYRLTHFIRRAAGEVDERHYNWYAPELGFLLRHRHENPYTGVPSVDWQVARVERPGP